MNTGNEMFDRLKTYGFNQCPEEGCDKKFTVYCTTVRDAEILLQGDCEDNHTEVFAFNSDGTYHNYVECEPQ